MRIFKILSCAILLGSCKENPPHWYYATQSDTANLYGVGSSPDLQNAKDNAINDMLSAIKVDISSHTSFKESFTNGVQSSATHQNIQKTINTTTLSNVSFKQELVKKTYYVQAQMTKNDFIREIKDKQKKVLFALEALGFKCKDLNINQLSKLESYLKELQELESYLGVFGIQTPSSSYEKLWQHNTPKPKLALIFKDSLNTDIQVSNIQATIERELLKFYTLDSRATQKAYFSFDTLQSVTDLTFNVTLKITDCNAQNTFLTQFSASLPHKQTDKLIKKIGVLLYKQLSSSI